MNIGQLENAEIAGDAFSDQRLMDAIAEFVVDADVPMSHKRRALRVLDRVMGLTHQGKIIDQDVHDFIDFCLEGE